MAGDWFLLTSQFAAAIAFLALSGLLLAVKFNSRVNRAFAVFLLLRGAHLLFLALARWQGDASSAYAALLDTSRYFVFALPFALLYFTAVYLSPRGGRRVRAIGVTALLATVAVEALYLVDHCLAACGDPLTAGPLTPVFMAPVLAGAGCALVLALKARSLGRTPPGPATALVAAALALLALLEASPVLVRIAELGWGGFTHPYAPNAWIVLGRAEALAALGIGALTIALLTASLASTSRRILLLACTAVVVATAVYFTASENGEASSQVLSTTQFLFGLWRLLAAALVAYALVRHRFLDLDLRINWTISRGTVLGILVATFLVVSKVIENQLNAQLGVLFGGIATGLLMLAIKPLEKLGDRVADGLFPRGARARLEAQQRLALFREQAMMVWSDGTMGRKERLLLDNLRERLGIEAALAAQVEHEAAAGADAAAKDRSLSTPS